MNRRSKVLNKIDIDGAGLEVGPLCWPVLKKSEANIQYVDHASTEKLRELYKDDEGVPSEQVVDVDFPLNGRSLRQAVKGKKFDYIIASHVIEHVPDTVGWLNDIASVLVDGGQLSLVIPDKRFTFDIDRNESQTADVVGAYLDHLKKPSSTMILDYISNYRSKVDASQAWGGQLYLTEETGPHRYSLEDALKYGTLSKKGEYIDTHCFVYTPSSFMAILRSLVELSLLDFKVSSFYDTAQGEFEFFITLEKLPKKSRATQLKSIPNLPRRQHVRELQKTISEYQQILDSLDAEIEHILNSRSWKLTKPLRASLRTLHKLSRRG